VVGSLKDSRRRDKKDLKKFTLEETLERISCAAGEGGRSWWGGQKWAAWKERKLRHKKHLL